MVSADSETKSPFSVIDWKKSGASDPGCEAVDFTAKAMRIGTAASTASPAMLRRRRSIRRSSEVRKRVEGRRTATRGTDEVRSGADIEALPGEADEDLLERGRVDDEAGDRQARVHAPGDDLLRGDVSEASDGAVRGGAYVAQAELPHHLGGLVGLVGVDPRLRLLLAADLHGRPLRHEPPCVHDTDVGADLLDLGEQMAGDEHARAVVGEGGDQGADLAGALGIESVGGFVEDQQVLR